MNSENKLFTLDNEENGLCKCILMNGEEIPTCEVVELLNALNDENEQLKKVLGSILIEVGREISNTNYIGEIKVFINPNSFELISEVLRKYGALEDWYE